MLGKRFESVHHARIRNNCSNLNNDLYSNHLVLSAFCDCGEDIEDAKHFLFNCNRFNAQRLVLFRETRKFYPLDVQFILEGSDLLSEEDNLELFKAIHQYIKATKRFE